MLTDELKKQVITSGNITQHFTKWSSIRRWLLSWEVYIIILIAAILRLYRLDTSEFSGDQTFLFRMAYDAVHFGLIPATSNYSSIGTANAPIAVNFLTIPVFFSSDPLWATAMTALFNVVAVLLAYIFTRRYYGRLAGTIAALLYATAQTTIVFSRFIWQPALIAPFVVLFLFALFWGVVERRKGWFFPAIFLLGVMFQLHEITILLAVPLLVAMLLVPKTIRTRDIVFGCISLLVIYAPFLVWEVSSHFFDIHLILTPTNMSPVIDARAITFYTRFLNAYYYDDKFLLLFGTYYDPTGSAHSAVFKVLPILVLIRYFLELCLLIGFTIAIWSVLRPQHKVDQDMAAKAPPKKLTGVVRFFSSLTRWWTNLRADPKACGLLVILLWQVVPVLALTRHGLRIHLHYLLMIVPGPFIFIGIAISFAISWLHRQEPAKLWNKVRYATYTLVACILLIQLLGSSASLVDMTNGINNHIFGYNDIGSLEHAFQKADKVAQEHHISRIYVTLSIKDDFDADLTGFPYLASQMHTPATLFVSTSCLVLPSPGEGPAVMLMRSTDTMAPILLHDFATATLVDEPPVLGSTPFKLYILTPRPFTQPAPTGVGFVGQLHLIDSQVQQPGTGLPPMFISRWTLLHNGRPMSRTTYNYIMSETPSLYNARSVQSGCLLTSMRAGDQLVVAFPISHNDVAAHSFIVTSQFLVSSSDTITLGALHFETFRSQGTPVILRGIDGSDKVTSPVYAGSK
ncbi:MAG TPA: glycosyltransferase family 39 protein [Ktedonobacteraceae bacterium]|nr:glycosyltransferase family 39 protein [Ktedonobacteraceae bacterium]